MLIYTRKDGFEVNDASDNKTIEDIAQQFGGDVKDWSDVTKKRDDDLKANIAASKQAAEQKNTAKTAAKASVATKLKALGLTDAELDILGIN